MSIDLTRRVCGRENRTNAHIIDSNCRIIHGAVSFPMSFSVVTSATGHHRIALARDWLGARAPAEEILIIGASLGAANELARSLAQEKRASSGNIR
jgi:hypothetical protein